MNQKQRARRILLVGAVLAALLAGFLVLVRESDRSPQADHLTTIDKPEFAGPAEASLEPQGRGTTATSPIDEAPVKREEAARSPVPAGSVRVIVRVRGRRPRDGTRVMITVLRDGEASGSLTWFPDFAPFPVGPLPPHIFGPRSEVLTETVGNTEEEASVLLSDIEEGEYAFYAVREGALEVHADRVELPPPGDRVVVKTSLQSGQSRTVRLEFPSAQAPAMLTVKVTRAGFAATADVKVRFGTWTIKSFEAKGETGETLAVAPEADLEVQVTNFQGSREFDPLPPRKVRLTAGQAETVTIELPVGVVVNVKGIDAERRPIPVHLSMWRLPESGRPRYVLDAMRWESSQNRTSWTGQLSPGRYEVSIWAHTGMGRAWSTFEVSPPGPIDVQIPLREPEGRRLQTRWLEADGTPAQKLDVVLVRESMGPLSDFLGFIGTTDSDGRLALPPLPTGDYGVRIWSRKLYRKIVVGDEALDDFEVRLPLAQPSEGTATLRGTVKLASGEPWSVLFLIERDGSDWSVLSQTSGGGMFSLTGLVPGRARIRIPFIWYERGDYRPAVEGVQLYRGEDNHVEVVLQPP